MLGGVFGETTGVAPGYKGSLSWWKLELYSEGEYVFDTGFLRGKIRAGGKSRGLSSVVHIPSGASP